tara:strand:+ start:755 stop:1405 length:651 start_codon:yes stop_codon:yes gene_type:complete
MDNPKMIDEKEVRLLLKNIQTKTIVEANNLTTKDMFRICRCLAPEYADELSKKEKNYAGAKCALTKAFPRMIAQMFLNCVWWETYGPDSFEYTTEQLSETMRRMKAVRNQCSRMLEENRKLEDQIEKVMEEKGLITQADCDNQLAEQKQKHNEQMDQKHIEDRNAYKTLQKRLSDMKSYNNELQSNMKRLELDIKYLKNENDDLIRQISTNALPPQ